MVVVEVIDGSGFRVGVVGAVAVFLFYLVAVAVVDDVVDVAVVVGVGVGVASSCCYWCYRGR